MWAWLGSLVVALTELIPSARVRKAIAPFYTLVIVIFIIVAGVAAIYFIVISSGPGPYP